MRNVHVLALLFIFVASCTGLVTAAKTTDGAAQIGTFIGVNVVPLVDKMKRDGILERAKKDGTQAGVDKAKLEGAAWDETLVKIKQAVRVYDAAVSTASVTLVLIISGVEKKLTFADVISQLSKATKALFAAFSEFGIDLNKYLPANLAGGN